MKKYILSLFILLSVLGFSACTNPMDKVYQEETLMEDLEKIIARDKLNKQDMENFALYLIKCHIEGRDLEGKTYKELFEEANLFQED